MNKVSFTTYIPDILKNMPEEIEERVLMAAMDIHKIVVESIGGQRSGRKYKVRGTKNVYYYASRPFETPAVMSGKLQQRYKFVVRGRGWNAIGYVYNTLKYAKFLEYGTRKMAMRPHLRKAAYKVQKDLERYFVRLDE